MKNILIAPLIHLNGDHKETLIEAIRAAAVAVRDAQRALLETMPNQRNFYPLPHEAWIMAREQYQSRQERLQGVYNELFAIAEAIQNGTTEARISLSAFGCLDT